MPRDPIILETHPRGFYRLHKCCRMMYEPVDASTYAVRDVYSKNIILLNGKNNQHKRTLTSFEKV